MEYWDALDRFNEHAQIMKYDDGTVSAKINVEHMTQDEVHSVVAKLMQAAGVPVGVAVAMTSMASAAPDVPGLHRQMAMAVMGDPEAMKTLGLELPPLPPGVKGREVPPENDSAATGGDDLSDDPRVEDPNL